MELRVTIAETAEEKNAALALRWDVFVQEQRVPESLEQDEWDATATHFLAYAGDDAVGTARLRPVGPKVAKVERVAVLSPYRRRGIGRALMDKIERYAKDLGMSEMILHAQDRAVPFYKKWDTESWAIPLRMRVSHTSKCPNRCRGNHFPRFRANKASTRSRSTVRLPRGP